MDIVCSPRPIDRGAQTNCHFLIADSGHWQVGGTAGMKQPASVCLFLINREKVAQRAGRRGRCQVCEEGKAKVR